MTGLQETNELFQSGALEAIKGSEPSLWLAAPPELLHSAKAVSELLFSVAGTYSVKSELNKLLTDRFDAEQIWQQIDLQARPLLSTLRRRLGHLANTGETIFLASDEGSGKASEVDKRINGVDEAKGRNGGPISGSDLSGSESYETDDKGDESEDDSMDAGEGHPASVDEGHNGVKRPVEDSFLKLNEMERFLDFADAEDAGTRPSLADQDENAASGSEGEEDEEGDDDDDTQMDDAFNYSAKLVENHQSTETEQLRYEDFFGKVKKQKRDHAPEYNTADLLPEEGDEETDEDEVEESDGNQADTVISNAEVPRKSAHEKKLEKIRMQVEQLEKENLEPKTWTLQGEVTAAKRPKNSALEVELDFDHNVRPPPVITEEVTASLEDIIKRRIGEEQFDDVERKPRLPVPSPSVRTEIDENKSQKGLADIYEAEYVEKSGLAAPTLSSSEKLKEEATTLFKALCGRLDSLSHFHFAPKPIVEDMTIRANVPALAMEEVAPLAVSDASMLAPEEVFAGRGLIKDEKELTQSERKRRRARKKRKSKAERQTKELAKKLHTSKIASKEPSSRHDLHKKTHSGHSSYTKSSKVFAELDKNKDRGVKIDKAEEKLRPSFLKL